MNYVEDLKQLNLFQKGLNAFGQNPISFAGAGVNAKAKSSYEAGVPSTFIQDGDLIVRLNVVDGYLQSSNFVTGSTGWRIDSDGNVEFASGYFRGDITGANGTFSGSIAIGSGNNIFKADSNGIYLGNATFASAPFRVTMAGAVTASNITITGGTIQWSTVAGTTNAPANNATVGANWSTNLSNIPASATASYITSTKITSTTIESPIIKASSNVWLGDISGHSGLSLNGDTDYNNIFFKRNSDGIVFFRINSGGAHSLTFDSSSGILALRGQLNADDIIAGTITGRVVQSTSGNGRIIMNTDDTLSFLDGAGNTQGVIKGYADDLRISATDNIDLCAGGRTALNLGYTYCVPVDDGHYTLGNQTGKGLERVCSYAFTNLSDRRLKKNIKTIDSALDKVLKLRGVYFNWKQKNLKKGKRDMGLIAQEVLEIIPEVVEGNGKEERYTIDYGNMVGLLAEAIKEQQKQIDVLRMAT